MTTNLKTLQDHFSIALQLYYKFDDFRWNTHIDLCTQLIGNMRENIKDLDSLEKELIDNVLSISETDSYTHTLS